MIKELRLWLDENDIKRLKMKAEALNFIGKANIRKYLEKIAREEIVFLDSNAKALMSALNLSSNNTKAD